MMPGTILQLLAAMVLTASCFPLIMIGLNLAPHLAFAAMRASLSGLCLLGPKADALGASSSWSD
jgi:hypothetical protein